MENKYILASFLVIAIVFSGIGFSLSTTGHSEAISSEGVTFDGYVTVKHYDVSEGVWDILKLNEHNVFTEDGKNWTRQRIGEGGGTFTGGATFIGLTNETYVPDEAHDYADWSAVELAVGGLSRAACTFANSSTTGQWNCTHIFTATVTVPGVHAVASLNNITGGNLIAETNFTAVTLENGDQIQTTWNYTVS